tara:strand:+ start:159 stop:974 length:816 start_codon:yes stop_codon:yes gene_type:complete
MPKMPGQLGDKNAKRKQKARRADSDAGRESAARRGYGHEWRTRTRIWVLRRDPICSISGCNEASTDVDHIIPKRMGGPDTPENLQGLCGHHHKVKTANESAFRTQSEVFRFVVCGPPASGKSTWIDQHAQAGDLVFDTPCIGKVLFGRDQYHQTESDTVILDHLLESLVGWMQLNAQHNDVYIVEQDRDRAEQTAKALHACLVVMDATQDECISRIDADPYRSVFKREQIKQVNAWFGKYGHPMEPKTGVYRTENGGAISANHQKTAHEPQ